MQYEPGKSYAWFMAYGRGYAALYAYPGNQRTRYLKGANGKPQEFASSLEAIAAAQAQVRKVCEPDIRAERDLEDDPIAAGLVAEIAAFKSSKAVERAEAHRLIRRGGGRKPVQVETKRRRAIA